MSYAVSVDLSAKVEQWSKNTAVAYSNGIQGSVLVRSKIKQKMRDWLKVRYPNRRQAFYYRLLFALFIYILIKPVLNKLEYIVIDRDYPGKESEQVIKDFLLNFLQHGEPSLRGGFIKFREVRGSKADVMARDVYEENREADREISLREMQQYLIRQ